MPYRVLVGWVGHVDSQVKPVTPQAVSAIARRVSNHSHGWCGRISHRGSLRFQQPGVQEVGDLLLGRGGRISHSCGCGYSCWCGCGRRCQLSSGAGYADIEVIPGSLNLHLRKEARHCQSVIMYVLFLFKGMLGTAFCVTCLKLVGGLYYVEAAFGCFWCCLVRASLTVHAWRSATKTMSFKSPLPHPWIQWNLHCLDSIL